MEIFLALLQIKLASLGPQLLNPAMFLFTRPVKCLLPKFGRQPVLLDMMTNTLLNL